MPDKREAASRAPKGHQVTRKAPHKFPLHIRGDLECHKWYQVILTSA